MFSNLIGNGTSLCLILISIFFLFWVPPEIRYLISVAVLTSAFGYCPNNVPNVISVIIIYAYIYMHIRMFV